MQKISLAENKPMFVLLAAGLSDLAIANRLELPLDCLRARIKVMQRHFNVPIQPREGGKWLNSRCRLVNEAYRHGIIDSREVQAVKIYNFTAKL